MNADLKGAVPLRSQAPTGELTLLFTDIEGSTHLVQQLGPQDYAGVQARHRQILRAAFEARAGREVDTQGDAFDCLRCNTVETRLRRPAPVGVFPEGDTPNGACDLTGNVFEWTASAFGHEVDLPDFGYPYLSTDGREDADTGRDLRRVIRGGSWFFGQDATRAAHRVSSHPSGWVHLSVGFRVARSA